MFLSGPKQETLVEGLTRRIVHVKALRTIMNVLYE
jgi:hypothetical protein